uniref:Uncharacterized protein n=1 Tax=Heliothis virescens TaxID=7102 RepID=A0A2A4K538_HELVI
MAITSLDISCDKIPTKSACSAHSSKGGNSCRLVKINFASADRRLSSAASKRNKTKKINTKSPYLTGDRVQLLSRVTEKRLVHKKTTDIVSSFPLAVNIYKANSDEFKSSKKANKKVKKSVLTLPNDPAPAPQYTVSDMNDSEYCEKNIRIRKQKVKKRNPTQNSRKARVREKDFEFYDRDAQYCSQLNISLDCSSTDIMKNFNGDGSRISNKKKNLPALNQPQTASSDLSDVWTVLRNINKFQFRPSPPLSEESIIPVKKKVQKRQRRSNRKDTRVIETCRTEEFAYISSYEVDDNTNNSFSPSSSLGRITVIDKKDKFSKICEEFEKRLLKTHEFLKDSNNNNKPHTQKHKNLRKLSKVNLKALGSGGTKENKIVPMKKKKKSSSKAPIDQLRTSEPLNTSANRDSFIVEEISKATDDSDILSPNTDIDSMLPTNGSFISPDYSESSRVILSVKTSDKLTKKDNTVEDPRSQLKEPSKTLNKDQESTSTPKRPDSQKRKPRLVTTMPSSCTMPKLTQAEIKRKLANIRFPIVILGKDQVSSGIKVMDEDPPQFSGLDEHIWPFMVEWTSKAAKDIKPNNSLGKNCNSSPSDTNSSKSPKTSGDKATRKQSPLKEKKPASGDSTINKKKVEVKRPLDTDINDKLLHFSKKQKSIVQLKDKMLNFLYKKSSCRNIDSLNNPQNDEGDAKNSDKVENKNAEATEPAKPENILALTELPKRRTFASPFPIVGKNRRVHNYAYPWAKAKWASDFIENVIKKIRSGVYYTQEHRDQIHRYEFGVKEVSVQAGSVCDSSDSTQTYDSDTEPEPASNKSNTIPGFDNTLPMLEIKTLNMNQIAVKHCVTNVLVQFDVTVPTKGEQNSTNTPTCRSSPLIPVEITDSHTKVFKCKTTLFNAVLPAEICSILPQMMSAIIDSNLSNTAICPTKTESCLSTITELTRYETGESLSIIASSHESTEMKPEIQGSFTNKAYKKPLPTKICSTIDYDNRLAEELLPKFSLGGLLKYEINPRFVEIVNAKDVLSLIALRRSIRQKSSVTAKLQTNTSTSMEVYTGSNRSVCSNYKPFNVVGIIESILRSHHLQINMNLTSYFDMLKMQYDGKNIKINMSLTNNNGVQKNVVVTVNNLKVDSLFKAFPKMNSKKKNLANKNNPPFKCMEYANRSLTSKLENMEVNRSNCTKIKRKGFYKLYRKCKSTTNIPSGDKCTNTPLSKIATLEDFFQILGSKRLLCSVFDGYAAKKILSSITEMKNWITEINPKQALLILLLTNKKDTMNLVRFRPIILQGIAVNRITRATELDMEIEVIERENLNKFPQASDYQKPFDETSERLLRSLLEKRKKLNPSYLRVMARYVGLGLLKSPAKC